VVGQFNNHFIANFPQNVTVKNMSRHENGGPSKCRGWNWQTWNWRTWKWRTCFRCL